VFIIIVFALNKYVVRGAKTCCFILN